MVRDAHGAPTGAPLIARLPDGRQMALAPADDEASLKSAHSTCPGLVGRLGVVVQSRPARYRLAVG